MNSLRKKRLYVLALNRTHKKVLLSLQIRFLLIQKDPLTVIVSEKKVEPGTRKRDRETKNRERLDKKTLYESNILSKLKITFL